ncbi:hypothetical protein T265_06696 [Opisthorchis viverrini]|uniref:Uncharacterized protein n=1 Tax=Opisthorchis viverrini TaxID=6198 RepID=A0A074ZFH8_OPIVI|nr:hypothetical protein T265_06696 [Opisthorchis viverrini]KER25943.1 hypothetical protein T265_06696 [Opisthorchis viverrini]
MCESSCKHTISSLQTELHQALWACTAKRHTFGRTRKPLCRTVAVEYGDVPIMNFEIMQTGPENETCA